MSLPCGNTAPFKEMLQRWRFVGNTVTNLSSSRYCAVVLGGLHPPPPNGCLCPFILVYSKYCFGISRNDKITDNEEKIRLINTPLRMCQKRYVSICDCYQYFVSDYDLKQFVKTFFKDQLFLFFRTHSRFSGHSQWRNQGEGAKGTSVSLSRVSLKI